MCAFKKERNVFFMIKNYKQILIICGLLLAIIVGVVIYFFQNREDDYSYLEISNNNVESTNVEEEKIAEIVVHITGQVINPGIVKVNEGARIIDAIEAAGGATAEADLSKINLAYVIEDGIKIYVPSINDKEEEYITEDSGNNIIVSGGSSKSSEKLMVNINTASAEELQKLPGIGEAIATRIVNYRKENGKFGSIEDIKNVSGIGDSKFENIKGYICVK
jgi:competence protein ComEA